MEKEKQIEEMARALCGKSYNAEKGFCNKFDTECDFMCNAYMKSKRVYALGYGNVKEAVKETAREILKMLHGIGGCDATEEWSKGWDAAIDEAYKELSDKYGVTAFDEEDEE